MIKIMTHEEFLAMAHEYAKQYVDRYKTVAQNAYVDGMMDALKYMRDKFMEL